ncbi:SMC-Scp complex subunit ScpB [Candidatus Nitrosotalea okcheonensis]|uniref:Chromosome segregation and condensation protein ScpB n=1 Tax=Candidatus Nitrosotalea okcheonensis TaxID=1903276 RepID=A0A2H1FC00_9ARCH|nr:SMC-Scp complex subunit ScpB [Candidatus Nitrosotalea okcheonensis]SMH70293.1 Chromosome segregation and condensation protein ScpB [Candidatus Nitrosotalea okcheonensis]
MGKIEDDDVMARLEAALYSAGRPLTIEELIKASGTESRTKTLALMTNLVKKTKTVFKAIEVASLPDGSYVFQLKPEFNTVIRKYASKPLLPTATLKTLSYIAYMQPVSSKRLVEVRGSGVYMHLKLLQQLDYIEHQNVGRLKIYNTTEKFQKYFGIQGDKDILKQKLFTKVRSSSQAIQQQTPEASTEPLTQTSQ